jgi:dihydrofolate reductase
VNSRWEDGHEEDRGRPDGVGRRRGGGPETWTGPYFSPEVGQRVGSLIAAADTLLLGRVTYQTFAASFAGNTSDPMAAQMNAFRKVVVSTTLQRAEWENSTLVRGDTAAEIARLKQQPGKYISVGASGTLVRFLLTEGLLDEFRLLVHPGGGRHRRAPVRGRRQPGTAHPAGIAFPRQWRRRAPLRAGCIAWPPASTR